MYSDPVKVREERWREGGEPGETAAAVQLPEYWKLLTPEGIRQACVDLWGVDVGEREVQEMGRLYAACQELDGLHEGFPRDDVSMLLRAVDFRSCVKMACPWAIGENLPLALLERHGKVLQGGVAAWGAAVTPGYYQYMARKSPVDWVFLSVPVGMEEMALTVAVAFAAVGVALLVDRGFVMGGPPHRQALLQQYQQQTRLALVSRPSSDTMWVCVFAQEGDLRSMCTVSPL